MTYKEYTNGDKNVMQAVRMRINRAAKKGLITKVSVKEHFEIPEAVMLFLTGNTNTAIVKQEKQVQSKSAKQATIPARYSVQYTEPEKRGIEQPQKSIFDRLNSFLSNLDEVAGILFVECVMLSYGLISKYGAMGVGLSMLYAFYSRYVVRLSKKEKTINTANNALNFFIFVQLALVYVHCNMYYNEMTADKGLMFDPANLFAAKGVSLMFAAITSLFVIVSLTYRIKETREGVEYEHLNAPPQNN